MNSSVHIEAVTQGGITHSPQQHGGGVARGLGWLMPYGVLSRSGLDFIRLRRKALEQSERSLPRRSIEPHQ
jgi:hypothetical protein